MIFDGFFSDCDPNKGTGVYLDDSTSSTDLWYASSGTVVPLKAGNFGVQKFFWSRTFMRLPTNFGAKIWVQILLGGF